MNLYVLDLILCLAAHFCDNDIIDNVISALQRHAIVHLFGVKPQSAADCLAVLED